VTAHGGDVRWLKLVILSTILLFGLVVLPYSIAAHRQLYADGSAFLLSVIVSKSANAWVACRCYQHILVQAPAAAAAAMGLSGHPQVLSRLYGAALFYFPFAAVVGAVLLLLRRNRCHDAAWLLLAYVLMNLFTHMFIVGEGHLCAALFLLQFALILVGDNAPRVYLPALLGLALLNTKVYESNVGFAAILLVTLILRWRGLTTNRILLTLVGVLAAVYVASIFYAGHSILYSRLSANRDELTKSLSLNRWNCFPALVTAAILIVSFWRRIPKDLIIAGLCGCLLLALGMLADVIPPLPPPVQGYLLRGWNLLIPAVIVVMLLVIETFRMRKCDAFVLASLLASVTPVTAAAHVEHTRHWRSFTLSFDRALRDHTGYVDFREARLDDEDYGWFWTYPTMSIVLQAFDGRDVQCILENRHTSFQPYSHTEPPRRDKFAAAGIVIALPQGPYGDPPSRVPKGL